jgi:hypothetical protein
VTLTAVCKALLRPARAVARHVGRGLTAIGLSMHGRPYHEADADLPDPEPVPVPAPRIAEAMSRTRYRDDLASAARLTPDELLWQAELDQRS